MSPGAYRCATTTIQPALDLLWWRGTSCPFGWLPGQRLLVSPLGKFFFTWNRCPRNTSLLGPFPSRRHVPASSAAGFRPGAGSAHLAPSGCAQVPTDRIWMGSPACATANQEASGGSQDQRPIPRPHDTPGGGWAGLQLFPVPLPSGVQAEGGPAAWDRSDPPGTGSRGHSGAP